MQSGRIYATCATRLRGGTASRTTQGVSLAGLAIMLNYSDQNVLAVLKTTGEKFKRNANQSKNTKFPHLIYRTLQYSSV